MITLLIFAIVGAFLAVDITARLIKSTGFLAPVFGILFFLVVACIGMMIANGIGALMPKVVDITITPLYNWGSQAEPLCLQIVEDENSGNMTISYIPVPTEGKMPVAMTVEGDDNETLSVVYGAGDPVVRIMTTRFKYPWMDWIGVSNKNGSVYTFYVPEGSVEYDLPFLKE